MLQNLEGNVLSINIVVVLVEMVVYTVHVVKNPNWQRATREVFAKHGVVESNL